MKKLREEAKEAYVPNATDDPLTWSWCMVMMYWQLYKRQEPDGSVRVRRLRSLYVHNEAGLSINRLKELGVISEAPKQQAWERLFRIEKDVELPMAVGSVAKLFGVTAETVNRWAEDGLVEKVWSDVQSRYIYPAESIKKLAGRKLMATERKDRRAKAQPDSAAS